MKIYSENKEYKLYHGSMLDMLEVIQPNSIDSIITDPPYGLTTITKRFGKENSAECQYGKDGSFQRLSKGFMGKEWDGSGIEYNVDAWRKCYEVLKPGGYLLAFGGSRTFHRIACAIEDAGFEIRDTIMWLYGSGFPKSMNIGLAIDKKNGVDNRTGNIRTDGKATLGSIYEWANGNPDTKEYEERKAQNEWDGWGTCLKPAYEPIVVARKPVENSVIDNVLKYGVGGINIDECRVETNDKRTIPINSEDTKIDEENLFGTLHNNVQRERVETNLGRFPSNVILTYDENDYEEVCGSMPNTKSGSEKTFGSVRKAQEDNLYQLGINKKENKGQYAPDSYGDEGSAARYFYCAKASKFDRDEGLEDFEEQECKVLNATNPENEQKDDVSSRFITQKKNIHPTVKPVELMRYLVRLVSPKGATILDCFNGSGSTGKAVMLENKQYKKDYKYIGIELTEEYLPIAKARIEYICNNDFDFWKDENNKDQFEVVKKGSNQLSMFDFINEEE